MQTAAVRRLLAPAVVVAALAAACSADGGPTPTSLPPTTAAATPSAPTGAADVVRRWVTAFGERDLQGAYDRLAAPAQERVGDPEGLQTEREVWAPWATAGSPVFDALPVEDELAVVVLRGRFGEEGETFDAAALPVRADGDRWRVDAFADVGPFEAEPPPGSTVAPGAVLAVEVDDGLRVVAFVDGQPADDVASNPAGEGRQRVQVRPERPLAPGHHVLTVVLVAADGTTAARALVYTVE